MNALRGTQVALITIGGLCALAAAILIGWNPYTIGATLIWCTCSLASLVLWVLETRK